MVLHENSTFPILGTGPGTYLTPTGTFYGSRIYMQVESMMRTQEVIHPFVSASYAVLWMEYGMLGLILFGLVLLRLFVYAWQQEKKARSFFWKDYFRALQAIIFIYAFVGGVFPLWTHFQASIYLWLFPAIGVRYVVLQKEKATRRGGVGRAQRETAPRSPSPATSPLSSERQSSIHES
jgi:O-antigen ligase